MGRGWTHGKGVAGYTEQQRGICQLQHHDVNEKPPSVQHNQQEEDAKQPFVPVTPGTTAPA